MPSLNVVHLMGHLCKPAVAGQSANQTEYATATVAMTNWSKSKKTEEWKESTIFVPIIAFGYNADKLLKLNKGDLVFVSGKLSCNDRADEEGHHQRYWSVIANQVIWLRESRRTRQDDATASEEGPEIESGPDEDQEDIPF